MALSTDTISEIKNEAKQLRTKAEALLARAEALEAIVSEYENSLEKKPQSTTQVIHKVTPGTGFRAVIRQVLAESPEALRPRVVAERIAATGFKYGGNTPFGQVVGSEMARMKKANQLIKSHGKYRLAEAKQ